MRAIAPRFGCAGANRFRPRAAEDNVTAIVIHMPEVQLHPPAHTQTTPAMPSPHPTAITPPAGMPPVTAAPPANGSTLKWMGLAFGFIVVLLILLAAALFLFQGSFAPAGTDQTTDVAAGVSPAETDSVGVTLAIPTETSAVPTPTLQPAVAEPSATPLPPGENAQSHINIGSNANALFLRPHQRPNQHQRLQTHPRPHPL